MYTLVVSNCREFHRSMTTKLAADGFHLFEAATAAAGLQLLQKRKLDLLILDAGLTDMSVADICTQVQRFLELPVLVIAGPSSTTQDEIDILEAGADDYIPRAAEDRLFRARIQALLRRHQREVNVPFGRLYIDHHLAIDVDRARVFRDGALLPLSAYEFKLLALLIRNLDEVVTITEMIEELWPGKCESRHEQSRALVHTYIRRLRKKFEPEAASPKYIVNEYGLGYRFTSLL